MEKLTVADGCIRQPNFNSHRRAKNWVATVKRNLKAAGGLDRIFWGHRGEWAFVPEDIVPGTIIECGGDYYTGSGHKCPDRIYFRIMSISKDGIEVESIQKPE